MDEKTREQIRNVELIRLKLLREYPDRFEVSGRLPAFCDRADLLAWRQHFPPPGGHGPEGSEHWRRSRVQPTIPQLTERRIADEVRELGDAALHDIEPRAEDVQAEVEADEADEAG